VESEDRRLRLDPAELPLCCLEPENDADLIEVFLRIVALPDARNANGQS
jgi:hypothetical protein